MAGCQVTSIKKFLKNNQESSDSGLRREARNGELCN
jgi:hypothetical protein